MAWTVYQQILAVLMVVTGSINTLATKWADQSYSVGKDGTSRLFDHPFLQAVGMFLGEFSCLLAFKLLYLYYRRRKIVHDIDMSVVVTGNQQFNIFIFLPPALCDMIGTSIAYIGLNLTYASSFQMLRGSVIIFTGLLSVAFLERRLKWYEWTGMFLVVAGLVIVGVSDFINPNQDVNHDTNSIITGDLLIVMSQIVTAFQMVIEEKFVTKHNVPPLQAVGYEGFFGFFILSILLIPMYFIPGGQTLFHNPDGQLEDAIDGLYQIGNSWQVCLGILGTVVSIAFFNFAGVSVTKEINATTRMVLDSVRTLVIWIFSLAVRWQSFHYLQVLGFIVLVLGMCFYNDVFIRPYVITRITYGLKHKEKEPLLRTSVSEANSDLATCVDHPDPFYKSIN